jgi:hypothetical protein
VIRRKHIERIALITGFIGLILIFQPFSLLGYLIDWILILFSTPTYVIFTLIPRNINIGYRLPKYFVKTLIIVVLVVVVFVVTSI